VSLNESFSFNINNWDWLRENENEIPGSLHASYSLCLGYTKELSSIIWLTFEQVNSNEICPQTMRTMDQHSSPFLPTFSHLKVQKVVQYKLSHQYTMPTHFLRSISCVHPSMVTLCRWFTPCWAWISCTYMISGLQGRQLHLCLILNYNHK
jgi:hypothetical protein